jgi:hypothetical protein
VDEDVPGVVERERPVNLGASSVTKLLPGGPFGLKQVLGGKMPAQAWAGQDTDFDFSHDEPRSVDRGVGKAPPAPDPVGLDNAARLDQSLVRKGIQVIQYQLNTPGLRVQHIRQITHGMGNIGLGAAFSQQHVTLAGQRLDQHQQGARAAPPICVILTTRMLGTQGQPGTTGGQQWLAFLIEAHDRIQRVGGAGVRRQHMLHPTQERRRDLGNTPTLDRPRLQGVF